MKKSIKNLEEEFYTNVPLEYEEEIYFPNSDISAKASNSIINLNTSMLNGS